MRFNRFYLSIFLRIILIVLSSILFVYFINKDDNILTSAFVGCLVVLQTAYLIKYVNRTNRDLAEFLLHLQQGDTSVVFSKENIEKTFKGLHHSFSEINSKIIQIRKEKEQKEHYLNYVIDNIKTGLLAFNESGDIEFVNNQAKLFLNKKNQSITSINNLENDYLKIFKETKLSESTIIKRTISDDLYYLAFSSSEFIIDNKKIKLFTIHDVKQEIERSEIESWQKLTSVLTHEMMNSITPITSLAHAIKRYLKNDDLLIEKAEMSNELISDIVENADIIENRGKGLLEFIDNYRTITKLPKPKFESIDSDSFLRKIVQLFDKEFNEMNVAVELQIRPENHSFNADKGMIEQVIINLIKNSIEAFEDISDPQIELYAFIDNNKKVKIQVIDNGKGINPEIIDDIFIPFYTTKIQGSGVGLSLSRQIMKLHKGSIQIVSEPYIQTKVTLVF